MRIIYYLLVMFVTLTSCSVGNNVKEKHTVPNASFEDATLAVVNDWSSEARSREVTAYYDFESHEGNRSITMFADRPAGGRWFTKVALQPWSKYKFSGWVKTENLTAVRGNGAGFRFDAFPIEYPGLTGTNDWTMLEFEFETGNDDSSVLSCMMNTEGNASGRVWFDDLNLELISTEEIKTAVKIDIAQTKEPMSEYIYGQFIEHLGRCIYGGIWAEMVEDRKFWFAPGERESPWRINGKRELVSVDKTAPFVGSQTPVITVSEDAAVSIQQSGLGLKPDLDYTGRIILKATPGIEKVDVVLSWNDMSETVTVSDLTSSYTVFPLKFHSGDLTHNATLEVKPSGNGKVWVGTVSLMPSDNIEGFRPDVLDLLRQLDAPVYRWPGGNFVSGYDWKDGIGDRDKRPPRKNPAWQGVEHNDVGIHEFMTFCRLLGTEPYIAVNAGLGDSKQAQEEVEYCNGGSETPMGRIRTSNGQTEPWNVKWWSIGNEMYGDWQLGHMTTADFVKKHNDFADAMKGVDPSIKLIAVGDLGDWDRMVLANCSESMDLISEHFYRQDWHGGGLMTHVKQIPDAIREKADAHRQYRKDIPALEGKDIRICMDEWNYWYGPHIYGELGTRYFMRDALGIAAGINEYSRQSDIIFMANYAQTVNVIGCIKTNTTSSVFDPTGQVLKMYRRHFGVIPVTVSGESRPLDIAATLNSTKDTLTISVVNPTENTVTFPLEILGGEAGAGGELWQVTADDDMAYNEPGRPENVRIEGPVAVTAGKSLSVDPASISIYRLPVR